MSYVLNDYSTDSPMHFKRTLSRFARLLLLLLLLMALNAAHRGRRHQSVGRAGFHLPFVSDSTNGLIARQR